MQPVDITVGDDPMGFMSAIESLQFPKRKQQHQHMLSHEWSTRYVVRSHNHATNDTTHQKPPSTQIEDEEEEIARPAATPMKMKMTKKKERVKRRSHNPRVLDLSQKKTRPVLSSDEYMQKLSRSVSQLVGQ